MSGTGPLATTPFIKSGRNEKVKKNLTAKNPCQLSGLKLNFCPAIAASYIRPPFVWTKMAIPL